VLATLVSAGINLLGCTGLPRGRRAQIDVVPDDTRKFIAAAKKAGGSFSPKKVGFLIQGEDGPGVLADNLKQLAEHGINVTAIDDLSAGEVRWGAILWVDPKDVSRAGRLSLTLRHRHGRLADSQRSGSGAAILRRLHPACWPAIFRAIRERLADCRRS